MSNKVNKHHLPNNLIICAQSSSNNFEPTETDSSNSNQNCKTH